MREWGRNMNLGFLDQSSKVTPLLVRLYDSQRLHSLAADKQPQAKAELTDAICELLEMELSPRESELVADVMIGLIRQSELDLRQALADRLAVLDNVPLRLVLQLANDEISVAGSVLRKSSSLSDLDLIYIIKSKTAEYWQEIAHRQAMSDQVMNMLADTGDFDTALVLAENKGIALNEYVITALSDLIQGNKENDTDRLAQPLLRREEVMADVAQILYQHVGEELKSFIQAEYGISHQSVIDMVDDVLLEFIDAEESGHEFAPTTAMLSDTRRQKQKGLLTIKLMLGTLRRGQIKSFVAQFSFFTGLDVDSVLEVLAQTNGQGLAVACKAFNINKEDFVSMYLLTNRVRNGGRMVEIKHMTKAINYYTRIDADVARDIIKNTASEN